MYGLIYAVCKRITARIIRVLTVCESNQRNVHYFCTSVKNNDCISEHVLSCYYKDDDPCRNQIIRSAILLYIKFWRHLCALRRSL
jgi:hypothetical protein